MARDYDRCRHCGLPLTTAESRARGFGPECAGKMVGDAAGFKSWEQGDVRVERFERRVVGPEALVQCWRRRCRKVETRRVGVVGRPSELRCSRCGAEVEVLTIEGVPA